MASAISITDQDVLLAIDLQADFMPGGALAVAGGDAVVPLVNRLADRFANVVITQDWHPPGTPRSPPPTRARSLSTPGASHYGDQTLWPEHCVQGTPGAALHPDLALDLAFLILRKGMHPGIDSDPAFVEADGKTTTGLGALLRARGVKRVFACGLATDSCVAHSALDARTEGFETFVIEDACLGDRRQRFALLRLGADERRRGLARPVGGAPRPRRADPNRLTARRSLAKARRALPMALRGFTLSRVADFPVFDLARFEAASPRRAALAARSTPFAARPAFWRLRPRHDAGDDRGALAGAEAFFGLPPRQARRQAPYPGYPYGYLPPLAEFGALAQGVESPPDLKESFNGGPEAAPPGLDDRQALGFCYAPTIWPEAARRLPASVARLFPRDGGSRRRVMRVFAVALNLPEDFFAPYIDAPISALRALNYPALERPPAPGQIRAGAHTDYGSLTILLPQAGSRGLEIFSPQGRWIEVPPTPGRLRHQHRRPDGALDQRPLDIDAASRRHPAGRRGGAAPVLRLLPPAELGRRDRRDRPAREAKRRNTRLSAPDLI